MKTKYKFVITVLLLIISLITLSYYLDEIYSTYYKFFPEKLQERIVENKLKLKAMENPEPKDKNTTKVLEIIKILRTLEKLEPTDKNYSKRITYYENKIDNYFAKLRKKSKEQQEIIEWSKKRAEKRKTCLSIKPEYKTQDFFFSSKHRNTGIEIVDAKAVKSEDHKNIYFVYYKLYKNDKFTYPLLVMNKPMSDNSIALSMNDDALKFTGLGDARKNNILGTKFSALDDGYHRAQNCF